MKHFELILLLLGATFIAKGQKLPDSLYFIQKMIGFTPGETRIGYTDRLETGFLNNFKRAFKTTTIKGVNSEFKPAIFEFTEKEIEVINKKLSEFEKPYWTKDLFPNSTLLVLDSLDAILADPKRGWSYFHGKYGDMFCQFTDPIFLRNNTICIIQVYYKSDDRKGKHELSIYKASNGIWHRELLIFAGSW